MRLEREHEAAPGKASARSGDRRRHLDRVMAVVVDQRVTAAAVDVDFAVALEAAIDAREIRRARLRDRRVADADLAADGDRGERVLHVVHAGQIELDGKVGQVRGTARRSASGRRRS